MTDRQPITFEITCDWRRANVPPVVALRRLLKVLGKVFKARCLRCGVAETADPNSH